MQLCRCLGLFFGTLYHSRLYRTRGNGNTWVHSAPLLARLLLRPVALLPPFSLRRNDSQLSNSKTATPDANTSCTSTTITRNRRPISPLSQKGRATSNNRNPLGAR